MQVQLVSDQLSVLINGFGAEISSIKNKNGIEYMWGANKDVWGRHAPVLFPVVGKLKGNTFIFENKHYTLNQHGFARDMTFTLIGKNDNSCTFELKSNAETKVAYPFDFSFQIDYVLTGNKLIISYKVKNQSGHPVLFSVGAHPGFNCPLLATESFEDYFLEFESSSLTQTILSDGLRAGYKELVLKDNRLALSSNLFDKDALVFENNQINSISLKSTQSPHKIGMDCTGWPFFGIWTKKGSNQFICLEPWYGIADPVETNHELAQKKGIITLEAGREFNCCFSLTLT